MNKTVGNAIWLKLAKLQFALKKLTDNKLGQGSREVRQVISKLLNLTKKEVGASDETCED